MMPFPVSPLLHLEKPCGTRHLQLTTFLADPNRTYAADTVYGVPVKDPGPGTAVCGLWSKASRLHHVGCAAAAPDGHVKPHPAAFRAFEPGVTEDSRRYRWSTRQYEDKIGVVLSPGQTKLGNGVIVIAIIREFIAIWNLDLWRTCDTPNSTVKLNQTIWLSWVEYESQNFVKGVTHEKPPGALRPLFSPRSDANWDTLYMAESYLGIVDIVCGVRGEVPIVSPTRDVFWRSLEFPDRGGYFKGITDGLKIRQIVSVMANGTEVYGNRMACTLPQPHGLPLKHFSVDDAPAPERLRVFKYNEPGTWGYSFCWNSKMVEIHAHTRTEAQNVVPALYQRKRDHGPAPIWQFLPVMSDEWINLMWHHTHNHCQNFYVTLMTNKGRFFRLGPHSNLCGLEGGWAVADRPTRMQSFVYYTDRPTNISSLGFDGRREHEMYNEHEGPVAMPTPPFDVSQGSSNFFLSTVKLAGVLGITPCIRNCMGVNVVVGLILDFADRHQDTLGQVMLNHLGERMTVGREIWFRFDRIQGLYPNIVEVRVDGPSPNSSNGAFGTRCWFGVEKTRELEWWFTDVSCILQHEGRRTPRVKHRDSQKAMSLDALLNASDEMEPSIMPGSDNSEDFGHLIEYQSYVPPTY
jgi:hypothetical protein